MKRFIKINPNINSAISAQELALLIALVEQQFIIQTFSNGGWSKNYLMDFTNLGRRAFDKTVDKMVAKGLLDFSPRTGGGKNKYLLNEAEYNSLNDILDLTNNRKALSVFFKKFWKDGKMCTEITDDEKTELKCTRKIWKRNVHGKSIIDIDGYKMYTESVKNTETEYKYADNTSNNETEYKCTQNEQNVHGLDNEDMENEKSRVQMYTESTNSGKTEYKCTRNDNNMEDVLGAIVRGLDNINQTLSEQSKRLDKIEDIVHGNNKEESKTEYICTRSDTKPSTTGYTGIEHRESIEQKKSFFEKKDTKKLYNIEEKSIGFVFGTGNVNSNSNIDNANNSNQDNVTSTSSTKKIKDALYDKANSKDIQYIVQYFADRYPNGSVEYVDNAIEFFEELKFEIIPEDSVLSEIEITDVFKHFQYKNDRVFIYYTKSPTEATEMSTDELEEFKSLDKKNNLTDEELNLSEKQKIELIRDGVLTDFGVNEVLPIEKFNEYISSYMVDLGEPMLDGIKYNNPRIATMLIPDLVPDDEEQLFWRISEQENDKIENENLVALDFRTPVIKTNKTEHKMFTVSEDELSDDNMYTDIFSNFRITRHMNTDNTAEMLSNMLQFAFIDSGTPIQHLDAQKLLYAFAKRLGKMYTDSDFINDISQIIKKDSAGEYVIEY